MVLCDHRSIQVLYHRILIPATQKVIKARAYRIYPLKTGSCFWSVNYTRSKNPFLCSGNELQIFKYPPFKRTLCIDTYRINFVYQKWICKAILQNYNDIEKVLDFCQESDIRITALLHVNTRSENRRRKQNVVTTLDFGRCDNVIRGRDQNTTKT